MNYMEEAVEMIEALYKNNPTMKKALLELDPDVIRNLGSEAQKGISPEDVVEAFDGGADTLEYLRKKAEKQLALKRLYRDLCKAYSIKIRKEKAGKDEVEI